MPDLRYNVVLITLDERREYDYDWVAIACS